MDAETFRKRAQDARVLSHQASEEQEIAFLTRLRTHDKHGAGFAGFNSYNLERALAVSADKGCESFTFQTVREYRRYNNVTHELKLALAAEALGEMDAAITWAHQHGFECSPIAVSQTHEYGQANGITVTMEIS